MVVIFFLWLALAMGEVGARGSARDTVLATFNTALITAYPEREERAAIVMNEIIKSDVDIWCLQEVWYPEIQRKIYNGVKDYYPYVLSAVDLTDNTASSEPVCPMEMLIPAIECHMNFCSEIPSDSPRSGLCAALNCTEILAGLPEPCLICFQVSVPDPFVCFNDSVSRYEKTYGLMLLSTKELMNPLVQGQNNQSQLRGLMTASVDGVGDLLCTHLTLDFSVVTGGIFVSPPFVFPFLYSSYAEQQYDEVLRIIDFATSVDVPVLMGTFNHGPAAPGGITWQFPFNYGLMNARGFYSPYVLRDGRCTWCLQNAQAASFLPVNLIIDHIYITTNTMDRVKSVERIFDDIFTESGLRLSDNFGIKMTLSNVRENCNPCLLSLFFCESEIEELLPLPPPDRGQLCVP